MWLYHSISTPIIWQQLLNILKYSLRCLFGPGWKPSSDGPLGWQTVLWFRSLWTLLSSPPPPVLKKLVVFFYDISPFLTDQIHPTTLNTSCPWHVLESGKEMQRLSHNYIQSISAFCVCGGQGCFIAAVRRHIMPMLALWCCHWSPFRTQGSSNMIVYPYYAFPTSQSASVGKTFCNQPLIT